VVGGFPPGGGPPPPPLPRLLDRGGPAGRAAEHGHRRLVARTSQAPPVHAQLFMVMTLNGAPWSSMTTAKRPGRISAGGTSTDPPSSLIFSTAASVSGTAK